jgi:phenylalanyl-tRNA synthetase beta chain
LESAVRAWTWLSSLLRLGPVDIEAAAVPGWHPTRGARLVGAHGAIGVVGEVDPSVSEGFGLPGRVGYLEVSLDALAAEPRRPARAEEVSRYPASDVDLAFAVDESVPAAEVYRVLRDAGGELLESLSLFDVYRGLGSGRRSLAFRLRFRAADRTLEDSELSALRHGAIQAVTSALPAELRD